MCYYLYTSTLLQPIHASDGGHTAQGHTFYHSIVVKSIINSAPFFVVVEFVQCRCQLPHHVGHYHHSFIAAAGEIKSIRIISNSGNLFASRLSQFVSAKHVIARLTSILFEWIKQRIQFCISLLDAFCSPLTVFDYYYQTYIAHEEVVGLPSLQNRSSDICLCQQWLSHPYEYYRPSLMALGTRARKTIDWVAPTQNHWYSHM